MVLWVVMQCSSETARHLGGAYCFHLQRLRAGQGRNKQKQAATQLLDLFFYPEEGRSMFLWTTWHYNQENCTFQTMTKYSHTWHVISWNAILFQLCNKKTWCYNADSVLAFPCNEQLIVWQRSLGFLTLGGMAVNWCYLIFM